MDTNFADWNNADATSVHHDFSYDFNNALNIKSAPSPFEYESEEPATSDGDPFASSVSNGFGSIMGNNNISNHQLYQHNGAYDQNDFLMNFYVSPMTVTNTHYPLATTNHLSSYNPFHYHHEIHDADVNSNNDNWANFNADNFADFDTHFANMTSAAGDAPDSPEAEKSDDQEKQVTEPCFVATTKTVEISMAPPEAPVKREFNLGPVDFRQVLEELEEEEFYSLRDDSNDMSSLTEDNERKFLENTEVPEDDDDDFASADER